MMSHAEAIIQNFNSTIPGIRSAPYPTPNAVDTMELPMCLAFMQNSEYRNRSGLVTVTTTVKIDVFCNPATQEVYEDARETVSSISQEMASAYLGSFEEEEHYLDYGDVSGIQVFIDRSRPVISTGLVGNLRWIPEEFYFGFSLTVPVIIRFGGAL